MSVTSFSPFISLGCHGVAGRYGSLTALSIPILCNYWCFTLGRLYYAELLSYRGHSSPQVDDPLNYIRISAAARDWSLRIPPKLPHTPLL